MTRQDTEAGAGALRPGERTPEPSETPRPRVWTDVGLAVCVIGLALVIAAAIGIEMSGPALPLQPRSLPARCR